MPHSGSFKKGHVPWNKGISFYAGGRSGECHFKKDRIPVGATRLTTDGYVRVKTESGKGKWRLLHLENWKKKYGAYPEKGKVLKFIDGDRTNCEIDNLMLVDKGRIMTDNSIHNYPPELKQCIKMTKKLERMINEKQY